ncbi:CGNR zinc finger domain-containing protein [Micromonospora sp. WP24]|nr:CGNR zinc finger domain-containing protein [Micromonospora sp. WP24]
MSWSASERFEARPAPGGLALVQELVNTHATGGGGVDLLADPVTAEQWAQSSADQWAAVHGLQPPTLSLTPAGLRSLRELRDELHTMLDVPPDQRLSGPLQVDSVVPRADAQLGSDAQGRVMMIPLGAGADWLVSAVWSEILIAQYDSTWTRVKLCREQGCRSAFYDASRNSSGVWHNVRTCGNIANLRASRARRRAAD